MKQISLQTIPQAGAGRSRALHAIFFLSGIAGLGYQMAWTRMFAVGLGHEMPSVLAVVAAYFGGLTLGAWLLDRPVSRSSAPARWYAALETVIGLWGFGSIVIIPWSNDLAIRWTGVDAKPLLQWGVAFVIPLLALLPATVAMGATLPAMERVVSRLHGHARCVGGLYAANTAGAVAGVLISTFALVPMAGFRVTIIAFACVNLLCAGLALACSGQEAKDPASEGVTSSTGFGCGRLALTVFITGLLGIGYEVLCIRVLSQVTQNTVFSLASVLVAYLLGTAVGAAVYQRWLANRAHEQFEGILGALLVSLCTACLIGMFILNWSLEIDQAVASVLGDAMLPSVAREMIMGAIVFGVPTLFMGATFSHLVQAARQAQGGVGRATAINTVGGALAPILFGVLLLPAIGAKFAIMTCSLAYLALVPRFTPRIILCLATPLLLAIFAPAHLRIVSMSEGSKLRQYRDGVMAAVAVVEEPHAGRYLKVNNRFQMGATVGTFAEKRLGVIPLLLHPDPRTALFLGVGTGVSLGSAVAHPGLNAVGVELIPEAVELIDEFAPQNNSPAKQPALTLHTADARRFVRTSDETFDVIIGDLFHPARDGAGALYTIEHFSAVRERLAPGGLFCQWLPMYQLDEDMLRVIVRTFLEVFPHTRALIGMYNVGTPMLGLVGSLAPHQYTPDYMELRARDARLQEQLTELALTNSYQLFGCLLADSAELQAYSSGAAINTDDHPIVMFQAPRFAYLFQPTGYGRLAPFIEHVTKGIDSLVPSNGTDDRVDEFQKQLYAFIAARNVYMNGMIDDVEGVEGVGVRACLQSTRMSSHFETGYAVALEVARRTATSNPTMSRSILKELIDARPNNPEARALLKQMFNE